MRVYLNVTLDELVSVVSENAVGGKLLRDLILPRVVATHHRLQLDQSFQTQFRESLRFELVHYLKWTLRL